jgi:hypothetical protein
MGGGFFIGAMGKESGVWCVSDFGAHNVVKVCSIGADDLFRLVWAACIFGCFTVGRTGCVLILLSYGMLLNFNAVGFVVWCYTLLCFWVSVKYVLVV